MFKYRYPKRHTKIYWLVAVVIVLALVGWLFLSGKLNSIVDKDNLVARWEIYKADQVIKKNPKDYDALIKLGINHYILRNYDGSLKAYEQAVAVNPNGFVAWNNLGNVRRDSLNYLDAEKAYLEAIRVNPNYISAYINLADLYTIWPQDQEGDKQKKKILPLLQSGIKANPSSEQLQETLKAYIAANK